MFSMKTVYGLKALQYLAKCGRNEHVLISAIAEQEKIPKKFLEAILLTLKNEGLLSSKSGKGGGYQLAYPPGEITVAKVVDSLEGGTALVPCVVEDTSKKCEYCDNRRACGVRLVMSELSHSFEKLLQGKTIADMQKMSEEALSEQKNYFNYSI